MAPHDDAPLDALGSPCLAHHAHPRRATHTHVPAGPTMRMPEPRLAPPPARRGAARRNEPVELWVVDGHASPTNGSRTPLTVATDCLDHAGPRGRPLPHRPGPPRAVDAERRRAPGAHRPGRRHAAGPRRGRRRPTPTGSTTAPTCPGSSGPGVTSPAPALHPQLRRRGRARGLVAEVRTQARAGDGWVKLVGDWIDRDAGDLRPLWPADVVPRRSRPPTRRGARVTAHTFDEQSVAELVDGRHRRHRARHRAGRRHDRHHGRARGLARADADQHRDVPRHRRGGGGEVPHLRGSHARPARPPLRDASARPSTPASHLCGHRCRDRWRTASCPRRSRCWPGSGERSSPSAPPPGGPGSGWGRTNSRRGRPQT
jgi:hypothetical protein